MKRQKIWALTLALFLLAGCVPAPPAPAPAPTPTPSDLTWLHGFYANASFGQIHLAGEMDAVSLGWARLRLDETGPWVSTTWENGNEWVVPKDAAAATSRLDAMGVPYPLCVFAATWGKTTLEDGTQTDVLTAAISPDYRDTTAQVLAQAAEDYAGLTIDFEGLKRAEDKDDFTALIAAIRQALPADKVLYIAVPPDRWYHGYDYRALGRLCDKVILMAHDYQWTAVSPEDLGSAILDTPVAPIGPVEEAIAHFTDPDTGMEDLSKAVLGVAFSACGVEVDEEGRLTGTRLYCPGPAILTRRLAQPDAQPGWSEGYASPYVYYHDEEGQRYLVWYEDARSVKAKVDVARRYGLTGLSLWRLGTIPDYENYDVWSMVLEELDR